LAVYFFFQAEDGIRDFHVTGVQTCALPIFERSDAHTEAPGNAPERIAAPHLIRFDDFLAGKRLAGSGSFRRPGWQIRRGCTRQRSEERRVGKGCRARRWPRLQVERSAVTAQ